MMKIFNFTSKLIKKEKLTEDTFKFTFEKPDYFVFEAGQFVNMKINKGTESKWRSYSILNKPSVKKFFELCIKIVSDGFASDVLNKTKTGDAYEFKGPFGHFKFEKSDAEHWFLATGTGVVPFYSMINEHLEDRKRMFLILGDKTEKNLLFHKEFEELSKNSSFTYIPTVTREDWSGKKGRVQKHLPENISNKIFYICGLKDFVLETESLLLEKGVSRENIKKERYS